ncbi:MAG TPA: hypothetical protein VFS15_23080 [Kofleriaceae bacterium]|nr:hypothetical protein [Kofleriaceae bacterium]
MIARSLIHTVTAFLFVACSHGSGTPALAPAATPTPAATPAVAPVSPTQSMVEPMAKLSFMRGVWRGQATGRNPDGSSYAVTQTERMGPMLGGDIIVIEGRGYKDDGSTGFNAFAVVSWNAHAQKYELRSYAQGQSGTFDLVPTADGYVWEIPAGPNATIKYTATVKDNHWREVGEYVAGDQPPAKIFEMNLERVGDTDWPLGTPVPPR